MTPGAHPLLCLGLALAAPAAAEAPAPAPTAAVGERPEIRTAEQTFLRDQAVLLRRGGQTFELDLDYSRSEQELVGVQAMLVEAQAAWRLGVADDVQASVRLPWRYQALVTPDGARRRRALGDLSLGLAAVALRETSGRPNVVVSLEGIAPSGPGDAGVGGGLSFTRSQDPLVLFCGLAYLHGLSVRPDDPLRTLARHNLAFNAGYAFAVNDTVALTGQVLGRFRERAPREQYRLRLGLTYLVGPRLFVEPTVTLAVGGSSPDVAFGLSVPWSP